MSLGHDDNFPSGNEFVSREVMGASYWVIG
ncbi:hypothetical protein PFLU4_16150 [Pseudomonas fluorescens]|jgi:hypothetical protein|nr:hypothetical protein PFLU4_16150 [Pseudomonas fluorescens]RDI04168.1 hypothetical protein DFO59_105224 [Pseudomonas fluorescens]UII15206.1 hypothetical protein LRP86_02096 [Pseudomonas brassicacearum]SDP95614.1 hypothetical protein SAMN04490180_4556 [Pseudomonas brassicacearum]